DPKIEMDGGEDNPPSDDFPVTEERDDSESQSDMKASSTGTGTKAPSQVSQMSQISGVTSAQTRVTGSPKISAILEFKPGDANYEKFEIAKDEIVIGRVQSCDIVLTDKKTSRKHTSIVRNGLYFKVCDLGSANGTYVNGQKISEHELSGDDVIRIGD